MRRAILNPTNVDFCMSPMGNGFDMRALLLEEKWGVESKLLYSKSSIQNVADRNS